MSSTPIPAIPHDEAGLAIAGPASATGLFVDGERAAVVGTQLGPLDEIWIDDRIVATDVRLGDGAVANVVVWPGMARRERVGPSGVSYETVLAVPTLPLVAVQRTGPAASVELRLSVPAPERGEQSAGAADVRHRDGRVVVRGEDGDTVVQIRPEPVELTVREDGRCVAIHARSDGSESVTVLIAAGDPAVVKSALAAAAHLSAHARPAREGRLDGGLALSTGLPVVDEGVQWARWRLRCALAREGSSSDPVDPVWATLAATAVGDREAAARGLALMSVPGHTKRSREDVELEKAVRVAVSSAIGGAGVTAPVPPRAAGRLPMVGEAVNLPAWVRGLVEGRPGPPPVTGRTRVDELCRFAALCRTNPDAAWVQFRTVLERGLDGGPRGPGTWDQPRPDEQLAPVTSALLIVLGYGILGLGPDEPVGRIRIAPRLPSHLTAFGASGITLGTSELALAYARLGPVQRFTLEPVRAALPPTAIFEPSIAGEVQSVRIDGVRAELDTRPGAAGRTVVPVQLSIDARRVIEIETPDYSSSTSM